MGYRRYCQKCKAPFYDKFADPIVCPSCEHSVVAFRFTQLKSSRLASGFYDEEKMDEVEDEDEDEEGEEDVVDAGAEGEDDILLIPSEDEDEAIVPPNGAAGEREGRGSRVRGSRVRGSDIVEDDETHE